MGVIFHRGLLFFRCAWSSLFGLNGDLCILESNSSGEPVASLEFIIRWNYKLSDRRRHINCKIIKVDKLLRDYFRLTFGLRAINKMTRTQPLIKGWFFDHQQHSPETTWPQQYLCQIFFKNMIEAPITKKMEVAWKNLKGFITEKMQINVNVGNDLDSVDCTEFLAYLRYSNIRQRFLQIM